MNNIINTRIRSVSIGVYYSFLSRLSLNYQTKQIALIL